jgi:prefoldin subunit 5
MIEKLQQIVARAQTLASAFEKLDAEHTRIWNAAEVSQDVSEVRSLAQQGRALEDQFQEIANQAEELDQLIPAAFDEVETLVADLRALAEDANSDPMTWAQDRADEANDDPNSWEEWADEQEESAPEQLSRRRAPMPFFRVG